ncbi:MAG: 16S rRNA (adenine(1518)-N(6)/adenine(1519)-N(6))-dimethyltransferase RsmA [Clostridia bacterium]|nr:16S rRNA (adenine(1518)-N(6)/adenine(1519)-N(6))-dimethyltransferase RsmA [Clostridia bacterium]
MNTLDITKKILRESGLSAKKAFGQNFLVDDYILEKIVEAGDITKEDIVIEIGPGLGNLTHYLLEKAKQVIAFEIDNDMISILNNRFEEGFQLEVLNIDIMKADLKSIIGDKKVKVIANLPYYITTPILFKLLEYTDNITDIVIMVQKEVADRILAEPHSKDYGVLTINTNYICDVTRVVDVPNTSFIPAPNVTSSVIKLSINNDKFEINDATLLKLLVKSAFAERRKKVVNSISNSTLLKLDKAEIIDIFHSLGFSENARAEEISVEQFVNIANKLYEIKSRAN